MFERVQVSRVRVVPAEESKEEEGCLPVTVTSFRRQVACRAERDLRSKPGRRVKAFEALAMIRQFSR